MKNIFKKDTYNDNLIDIAIIFGNKKEFQERSDIAIELYHQQKIKKIILSGSNNHLESLLNKQTEAELMKEYLISNNVLMEDIILEDASKTTISNITSSLKIINSLPNIKSILLITSDYHIKRCYELMILYTDKHHYEIFTISTDKSRVNKNNYFKSIKGLITAKKEQILLKKLSKRK